MVAYQYQPLQEALQEIRLVHLLPGEFDDDIRIRIIHSPFPIPGPAPPREKNPQIDSLRDSVSWPWDIEETETGDFVLFNVVNGETHPIHSIAPSVEDTSPYEPRYEALSYTWGDSDISEFGYVEDTRSSGEDPATLGLRPNLASALRYLRYSDETRVLWIDAICINQEDIAERNEQVKRMTNIYALAERVIAWLGAESNDSKHALATLQHMGQQIERTRSGRIIAAPNCTEPHLWRNDHLPSFDLRTWQSVMNFVERAWFYRLWCWQEIQLGSRSALLQCGSDSIAWRNFWISVLCLNNKDSLPSMRFRERCRHIAFLNYEDSGESLANILDISRSKGCVNPRDKIYGLLGITPTSFSSKIVVDYLRPVEEVYKEAFLARLYTTKRLELLKHCDLARRQIGGPSWVPDWSKTEFAAPYLSEQLSSGVSPACMTYIEPSTLEVIGKQYTTVKTVSGVASKVEEETLLAVKDWYQLLSVEDTYITGETTEEALALSLCMNRTKERYPYVHFRSIAEWVGFLRTMLRLTSTSQNDPIYSARETANTIQKIRGRRAFVAESGHIGTAPAGTQPGELGGISSAAIQL